MNWRRNGLLLCLLMIVGGWYYFYEIQGEKSRSYTESEARRLLPGLEPGQIQQIRIERIPALPNEIRTEDVENRIYRLKFERIDQEWFLTDPVMSEANQAACDKLAETLAGLERGRVISDNPESLSTFGLESPSFILGIEHLNGIWGCRLGDENPAGDAFYALVDDSSEVFLLRHEIKSLLTRQAIDFRNKSLLNLTRDSITKMRMEFPQDAFFLEFEKKDTDWFIRQTLEAPGDAHRIEEMLSAFTAQSIQAFLDEPGDMLPYGFQQPYFSVRVFTKDSKSFQIDVGDCADAGGKSRYARRTDSSTVVIVGKEFLDLFKPDMFHYRSKKICNMNRGVIDRILIEKSGETIELHRSENGGWTMIQPQKALADAPATGAYLSELTYLRATGVKTGSETAGHVFATIHLFTDTDTPATELQFLGQPEDGVGRWVKTSGDQTIFRVSDLDIERLLPDSSQFLHSDQPDSMGTNDAPEI